MTAVPDWQRAHGGPLFKAELRRRPEDFQVTEILGWQPSGDGEHDYLLVEKTGANTEWVARQLARHAGVPARDVGYAGLKDRHAVTRQWFSVPRWNQPEWSEPDIEGVRVLEVQRHLRKLRRGAHDGNRFRILLRCADLPDPELLAQRLAVIAAQGVPNYFGEQRFGRGGQNLSLADDWAAGRRLPRQQRGLAISTIRAFIFNQTLSSRVEQHNWNQLVDGDRANLDGSASVFVVEEVDEVLRGRCGAMDIHPALPLPGEGAGIQPAPWQAALDRARVEPADRSLRLRVGELEMVSREDGPELGFVLPRGTFATAVLRELCRW